MLPKKISAFLLFLFISLLLFQFFVPIVQAQDNPQNVFYPSVQNLNEAKKKNKKDAADNNKARVSGQEVDNYQISTTMYNTINLVTCTDKEDCNPEQTALGNIAMVIGAMYANPPASGLAYTYDLLANAGLAKPAAAQGIGFAGLSPFLPIWKITRNIAYSVIILIMIAIGFMVIFRMKIDPKTVISVQAALPKIVLSLILITLSFAIVGFLYDMMYLTSSIIINVIANGTGQHDKIVDFHNWYLNGSIWNLGWTIFSAGFSTVNDFKNANIGNLFGVGGTIGLVTKILNGPMLLVLGGVGLLLLFILVLGLLFSWIRIMMLLLNSYIQLVIAIILGPLQLLFEAIPGKTAFSSWILNIIANLIVFPTTIAILMFAEYLATSDIMTNDILVPPLTGVPGGEGAFPAFIALGIIFLAPTLIATVKKAFHPKPVLPISAGTAFAPLTGGAQTAMGAASQFYYIRTIPFVDKLLGGGKGQPGAR